MDPRWTSTLPELTAATGGRALSTPRATFSRVGTDTRADLSDRLFVALTGGRFDAHDFVESAVAGGAAAVMVSEWREEWRPLLKKASFVSVEDTLPSLQNFARYWRGKRKPKVLGITGSNGKTSTKEFALALLKPHLAVHASKGSFNNHWGVPLSILEADQECTHLILEMGMNHAGEITALCSIASPDVTLVTTVGRAHVGELGSAAAVAAAKEEIYKASPTSTQIFNLDNEWTLAMQQRSRAAKKMTFSSFNAKATVHLRAQRSTFEGLEIVGTIDGIENTAFVRVFGRHNVVNLMAAANLARAAGLTPEQIWLGLNEIADVAWGRNQILALANDARVLFDGYNANPDSVGALLKNLFEMDVEGRKFLIMGDMRELGAYAEAAHEEAGEQAAHVNFEAVWFVGEHAAAFARGLAKVKTPAHLETSATIDPEIAQRFYQMLKPGDLVAVKASRGVGLERAFKSWPLVTPLGEKP